MLLKTQRFIGSLLLLFCITAISLPLSAARKALLIGNADYAVKPLRNPLNDSSDMSKKLQGLGFQVTHKDNLNRQQMRNEIRRFALSLNTGDEAFFYYSGHGAQYDNKNYLIPIANDIRMDYEVSDGAVSLDFVLTSLGHSASQTNIVVLDACRDNPFEGRFKSSTRGLAKLDQQFANMLIAFAASPGGVSDDGNKNNGEYTQALLNHIDTPNISLTAMFTHVRQEVYKNTQGKQLPEEVNRLLTNIYFAGYKAYIPPNSNNQQNNLNAIATLRKPKANRKLLQQDYTNSIGMQFKYIPAGSFYRGSCKKDKACASGSNEDNDAEDDETPQHLVNISQGFQMAVHEVTVGQFKEFIFKAKQKALLTAEFRENNNHGDNAAVSWVSWDEAHLFIDWLNSKEGGQHYRLPTEAEWEYTARAGSKTKYSWGNDADKAGDYAWYYNNAEGIGKSYAHAVGGKQDNPWGLYDMHGNVWEWVEDRYSSEYYRNYFEEVSYNDKSNYDPKGPTSGRYRVVRGGSWNSSARNLRSAFRNHYSPGIRFNALGFRLLRQP